MDGGGSDECALLAVAAGRSLLVWGAAPEAVLALGNRQTAAGACPKHLPAVGAIEWSATCPALTMDDATTVAVARCAVGGIAVGTKQGNVVVLWVDPLAFPELGDDNGELVVLDQAAWLAHDGGCRSISWHPTDPTALVTTGMADGAVKLWWVPRSSTAFLHADGAVPEAQSVLLGRTLRIASPIAQWLPDGRGLAVASSLGPKEPGKIRFWGVPPGAGSVLASAIPIPEVLPLDIVDVLGEYVAYVCPFEAPEAVSLL